jgi:repressor LexA
MIPNDEKILAFIVSYWREHTYPPTTREIGAHMGFASTSTTHLHLRRLRETGRISFVPGQSRTIRVLA